MLNFNLTEAGEMRKLELSELDEIWVEAYESARSYKNSTSLFMMSDELLIEFRCIPHLAWFD